MNVPDLGHRDLVLAERLEQHGLERLVGAVDLVDQQHHRLLGADRLQQRAGREEPLGEEDALLGADPVDGGRGGRGRRRRPGRSSPAGSGCRAAACRSPTRRGPWSRPGPRSTAAAGAGGRWRRRAPWPARSCRRRPGPRSAAACPAGSAGRPSWPGAGRRCSPAARARRRPRRRTRTCGTASLGVLDTGSSSGRAGVPTGARRERLPPGTGWAQVSRSSRSPFMQWSTTGRTVSKVHSLGLPGVQASPRTWLVMRSTSASSPVIVFAFS